MSFDNPEPNSDPTADEVRLSELLESYEQRRAEDPCVGIGVMREAAGDLYPRLAELADSQGAIERLLGDEEEAIPARIGPYNIEALLGSGTGGHVYRARREDGDDSSVALKLMRDSMLASPKALERFRRETNVDVSHEAMVRVIDQGEQEGRLYYTMELIAGGSLGRLVERLFSADADQPDETWLAALDELRVPPLAGAPARSPADEYSRRLAALFAPVAQLLTEVGKKGLVHRDIKPENLLIDSSGRLRLSDFGLVKVIGDSLTSTVALGTPRFMSPEQATGRSHDADVRTDIYGLAATLHCALTLSPPAQADSFHELLVAIATVRPKPISDFCPDYPRGLAKVISRCLEKDPSDRYQDPDELARDLERVAHGETPLHAAVPLARQARKHMRSTWNRVLSGSAVAGLLIAVFLVFWFTRDGRLEIICSTPDDAEILVDDRTVGRGMVAMSILRGRHHIVIRKQDWLPERIEVEIAAGQIRSVDRILLPVGMPRQATNQWAAHLKRKPLPEYFHISARSSTEPAGKDLEVTRPDAYANELAKLEDRVRNHPVGRALAITALLERGFYPEAYHAAMKLADDYPKEPLPLELAITALREAELGSSLEYAKAVKRLQGIRDD